MITSMKNQQVKHILRLQKKAKARYEQRVFVIEGAKMCREAPKGMVKKLYVSEEYFGIAKNRGLLVDHPYEVVADAVFKEISDIQTPQGILGLIQMPPEHALPDLLSKQNPLFLLLEGIQDPGNLGAMLRVGEGAGVTGLVMDKHTVDVFNPKTVRSSMGSIYRAPFLAAADFGQAVRALKEKGVILYAAQLEGGRSYESMDYRCACGFLIGNEGKGLSSGMAEHSDFKVRIPMEGQVESLNAAMSAGILLYEAKRQRGGRG